MLPTSKQLLIWFDQNHTCIAPPIPSIYPQNKRFCRREWDEKKKYASQYHVTCLSHSNANKKFIYLLLCATVTKVLISHAFEFGRLFFLFLLNRLNVTIFSIKMGLLSIPFEIQKQLFEFNLSINSVTHGKIMSAQ